MTVKERLISNAALVEEALRKYTEKNDPDFHEELEAERYSLLSKAKRIRPTLVLEFCRLFGGESRAALPFAAAVEMVHTYSLIHDDLPCMDNDDLRRGRPTCHKAFDEATALLAGDGLLTRAFETVAGNQWVSAAVRCEAVLVLSQAAGSFGMIGGQVMDLAGEGKSLTLESLLKLHSHKTGDLIAVSAKLGCLAAGLSHDDAKTQKALAYARHIGLAFQIVDDVLDVISDANTLGKTVGSDVKSQKTTFLTFYDVDNAMAYAADLTARAKEALFDVKDNTFFLELADHLLNRKN